MGKGCALGSRDRRIASSVRQGKNRRFYDHSIAAGKAWADNASSHPGGHGRPPEAARVSLGRHGHRLAVAAQLGLGAALAGRLMARGWRAGPAVAAAAVALPAGYLAIAVQHWAAARLVDDAPRGDAAQATRPGGWRTLRMLLTEAADALHAFGWLMPFREAAALAAPRRPERVPVLLLHGYLCNRGLWHPMARRLAALGHPVEAVTLAPAFASIDRHAEQVARAVDALRARTGHARVAVVAHSMGGLALRAYLRRHGAEAVAAAVTLGTPHRGTRRARLAWGRNARQMRPGSAWLRRLAADEPETIGRLFTVVLARQDDIVVPSAGQTLPGATTVELDGIGHLSRAVDAGVARRGAPALRGQAARTPD